MTVVADIRTSPAPLLTLGEQDHPSRRALIARRDLCVGPPGNVFLFGGVGLGAALTAVEQVVGRPVVWSTAQFLGHVRPDEVLTLDVTTPAIGKSAVQAQVRAHVAGRDVLTVVAALGAKDDLASHQWVAPPDIPAPEACESRPMSANSQSPGTLSERLEMRYPPAALMAREGQAVRADSRLAFWMRLRSPTETDVAHIALCADFVPNAVAAALGNALGGTSLDNTLRMARVVPTEWVLCDAHIQAAHAGFAHGDIRLFSQDGQLLAIGSQTINIWNRRAPA